MASRRVVSMGGVGTSESQGGDIGDFDPIASRMPLERISEFDEASRRAGSSFDARSGGEEAKSESDEEATENSSLLRNRKVQSRHSRNTFGKYVFPAPLSKDRFELIRWVLIEQTRRFGE